MHRDLRNSEAPSSLRHASIDGSSTGDGGGLRDIWYDHARIVGSLDGHAFNLDPDEFCRVVGGMDTSPDVQACISSIEVQGRAARARIELLESEWSPHHRLLRALSGRRARTAAPAATDSDLRDNPYLGLGDPMAG